MLKGKSQGKPDKRVPVKKSSVLATTGRFFQSFYTDPFRWQLTKSVGVFLVGVYLSRDLSSVELFESH